MLIVSVYCRPRIVWCGAFLFPLRVPFWSFRVAFWSFRVNCCRLCRELFVLLYPVRDNNGQRAIGTLTTHDDNELLAMHVCCIREGEVLES